MIDIEYLKEKAKWSDEFFNYYDEDLNFSLNEYQNKEFCLSKIKPIAESFLNQIRKQSIEIIPDYITPEWLANDYYNRI